MTQAMLIKRTTSRNVVFNFYNSTLTRKIIKTAALGNQKSEEQGVTTGRALGIPLLAGHIFFPSSSALRGMPPVASAPSTFCT